jgi:putative transposase
MPYEYREMTQEQRQEVLRIRKERGYPLHAPPHPIREEGFYFLTATCYEHAHVMQLPERRSEFEIRLLTAMHLAGMEVTAWVVLPNHYHVLVSVCEFEQIPVVMKALHTGTSFEWNPSDGCAGKRKVWYHYSDRFIREEAHYFAAMNYIHYNPVKLGYVATAYDWVWSSLGLYYEDKGKEWLREKWTKYPPQDMGED